MLADPDMLRHRVPCPDEGVRRRVLVEEVDALAVVEEPEQLARGEAPREVEGAEREQGGKGVATVAERKW